MSNKHYLSSSTLFSETSLSKGCARTIDMFGTLDEYNYKNTEAEAEEQGNRLLQFFELLIKIDQRNKLKQNPIIDNH